MNKFAISDEELSEFMGAVPVCADDFSDWEPSKEDKNKDELTRLIRLTAMMDSLKLATQEAGIHKWFMPKTPFGIEHCPKHSAFFAAGSSYNERLFLAGNRTGKSISGAYESACHATG